MEQMTLPNNVYQDRLIQAAFGFDELKVNPYVLLLSELVKLSKNGYVMHSECSKIIKVNLKLTDEGYKKQISRLMYKGHIRKENGIIYLHPKYKAIKECNGIFVISSAPAKEPQGPTNK